MARLTAAAIALVSWIALAVQAEATFGLTGSVGEALWIMLRYFTVTTNLLLAVVMTLVAFGRRVGPFLLGGTILAIILVGVIYVTLLRGLLELSGGALVADSLLHEVTPLAGVLWWLAYAPKGGLRWRDPLGWALYPAAYLGYALLRGKAEGKYAYPFIDIGQLGLGAVLLNAVLIAAAFLVAGIAMVALDRRLGLGRPGR